MSTSTNPSWARSTALAPVTSPTTGGRPGFSLCLAVEKEKEAKAEAEGNSPAATDTAPSWLAAADSSLDSSLLACPVMPWSSGVDRGESAKLNKSRPGDGDTPSRDCCTVGPVNTTSRALSVVIQSLCWAVPLLAQKGGHFGTGLRFHTRRLECREVDFKQVSEGTNAGGDDCFDRGDTQPNRLEKKLTKLLEVAAVVVFLHFLRIMYDQVQLPLG